MGIRQISLLSSYLLSDGGMSPRGKDSWTIYFRNNDDAVTESFQECLKKCAKRRGYEAIRKDGSHFVKLHSFALGKELLKLSNSYRTTACGEHPICPFSKKTGRSRCLSCKKVLHENNEYPHANIPDEVSKSRKLGIEFLRIYATCDGGVSIAIGYKGSMPFLVRKVFIAVKHPILAKQLIGLLENIGYKPYYYGQQIRLTRSKDIIRFQKEIGFIKGAKISGDSKYLRGYEKNQILETVVESYNNPKRTIDFILSTRSSSELKRD